MNISSGNGASHRQLVYSNELRLCVPFVLEEVFGRCSLGSQNLIVLFYSYLNIY